MNAENRKLLVFAGTTEGRKLCERLCDSSLDITASAATEYGRDLLSQIKNTSVIFGRLEADEMCEIIKSGFSLVIDATHPYASVVTDNIKLACRRAGAEYVRLQRSKNNPSGITTVANTEEAARYLNGTKGSVLVTIGSKELYHLSEIEGYLDRLYVRVLPSSVSNCKQIGFNDGHIMAMQGPFSEEMNLAMLKQYKCRYLLTKNTGTAGGLEEKLISAEQYGAQVIMIDRPHEDSGYDFEQVCGIISKHFNITIHVPNSHVNLAEVELTGEKKEYFPLFMPSTGKRVLVIGGGTIAERRIKTLLRFQFSVNAVALTVTDTIMRLASNNKIKLSQRVFSDNDIDSKFDYVLVATNNRDVNHRVGNIARTKGIPVNVADCKEECDFFFPAVIIHEEAVVGLTCGGQAHTTAKYVADQIRGLFAKK